MNIEEARKKSSQGTGDVQKGRVPETRDSVQESRKLGEGA